MASKGTPLSKALTQWEEKNGKPAAEAEEIKLIFLVHHTLSRILPSTNSKPAYLVHSLESKNSPSPLIASTKLLTFPH
jgi:hypothetical protein